MDREALGKLLSDVSQRVMATEYSSEPREWHWWTEHGREMYRQVADAMLAAVLPAGTVAVDSDYLRALEDERDELRKAALRSPRPSLPRHPSG